MRLLSPPQGKSREALEVASWESRLGELDKLIVAKRKELNELDAQVLRKGSDAALSGTQEEEYWKERIATLSTEVEALGSRRRAALVPLAEREKKADDRDRALLERENTVALRESEVEATTEALERRLDEVSERETDANRYSQTLNSREFNVSYQEKEIAKRMDALVLILEESFKEVELAKQESARYKAMLKGRDVSISEREKYVDEQMASFDARERKIADRYRTLQRAITEVNLKNDRPGLHGAARPK